MSDTILSGDITVYYLDENRQKRMEWTGAATGTQDANAIYSAVATLLDEAVTGDDATAIFADTPVEYTVGVIDANDNDPWYMGYDLMEHVIGGSFRTSGWTRNTGTDTGIVVVTATNVDFDSTDLGATCTNSVGSDSGTLLEIIDDGTSFYLVIRPDSNAAANDWDSTSGTIDSSLTAHTATQTAAAVDGEQIWANYYNVTPIDADTHMYTYAGSVDDVTRTRVYSVNSTTADYWEEGAFDRLIPIRDFTTASNPLIDAGHKTFFARKGNTLYDSFEVLASTTSGGRNPVPLKASTDSNHTTGYFSITTTAVGTDDFTVGDELEGDTDGARMIITQIDGTNPTYTFHGYLIGDPLTAFQTAAEGLTNNDATGTATKDGIAPASQGPALVTWFTNNAFPTVSHANTTFDVANEGTAEGYAATLDCNSNPLTEVYQWSQYITQNGGTTTGNTDGIEGEQYQGPTVYLEYSGSVTGSINEGNDVTQETSLATGIVVSHDTTNKEIVLRDTRGTFATHATLETLTDNVAGGTVEIDVTADTFGANTAAPFGTFAGGRWFFARGIVPTNWISADENSWETIPSAGGDAQSRPAAISLSVSNLTGTAITDGTADLVNMHRLTGAGGDIDKTLYSSTGGVALGANTLVVDTAIGVDEPSAGRVNVRDESNNNKHYMIRYSSWATSTFTLAEFASFVTTAGTNTTTVVYATGGFNANVQRGDLVYNVTTGDDSISGDSVAYVLTVDSDTQLTLDRVMTSLGSGDSVAINVMPINDDTLDDVYPSLITEYATSDTEAVSIVYDAPIFYRVKVSNTRATVKQRRFVADGTTSGTDRDTPNIVNTDSIFT